MVKVHSEAIHSLGEETRELFFLCFFLPALDESLSSKVYQVGSEAIWKV